MKSVQAETSDTVDYRRSENRVKRCGTTVLVTVEAAKCSVNGCNNDGDWCGRRPSGKPVWVCDSCIAQWMGAIERAAGRDRTLITWARSCAVALPGFGGLDEAS